MKTVAYHYRTWSSCPAHLDLRSSLVLPTLTHFPPACVPVASRPTQNRPAWWLCALVVWVTLKASAQLTLTLPNSVVEGSGVLTNAGRVVLGALASSNTLVSLASSDPSRLTVPASVVIPSGQSNAVFALTIPDNSSLEGTRQIFCTAAADGFVPATNLIAVLDNDIDRFSFDALASPQYTNSPFSVGVTAYDVNGMKMVWLNSQISLAAVVEGLPVVSFGTNLLQLTAGQWNGNVTFTSVVSWVRLVANQAGGIMSTSQPFDVEPPTLRVLSLAARDIAYSTNSGRLWAVIGAEDSGYANSLVEVEPYSGTVTASYPVVPDPTRMEQTENGQYFYMVISNATAVRQFDLNTRQTIRTMVPAGDPPSCVPAYVQDLATVTGNPNLVVLANRFSGCSYGEIRLFDNGMPRPIAIPQYADPQQTDLETSGVSGLLYAMQDYAFSRLQVTAVGITLQSAQGLFTSTTKFKAVGSLVYASSGEVIDPQAFQILGNYPGMSGQGNLVEVDPVAQRTLFLSGQAYPYSHVIRAYDQRSLLPVESLNLAGIQSGAGRFLRYGSNGLAFCTGGQLALVNAPRLVPGAGLADLVLSQTIVPDTGAGGSNFICTLTVSNRGPQTAFRPVVKNPIPLPATLVSSNFTAGAAFLQAGMLEWRLSELPAGGVAVGTLVLAPDTEVFLTNSASVVSRTVDTNFTNNVSTAVPQLPPVDLALSQSYSPNPAVAGSNITYSLVISNAGPAPAWQLLVTDQLPGYSILVGSSVSLGSLSASNGLVKWRVAALAPGATATASLTVSASVVGLFENTASVGSWSSDSNPANNRSILSHYMPVPTALGAVFRMALATEDLLYDPLSQRIVASLGQSSGAYSNSVVLLNPEDGHVEAAVPLGQRPARLARSDDGQFLYVSLPDDALVRRLTLTNLAPDLELSLGGEYISGVWYPFYAADLAVVPGNSDSLAAWRVRRPGPMAGEYGSGIALFDHGVMRTNVTASGGSWRVEYDTNTGTLFAFSGGDMRRCSLDSGGLTFLETFPTLAGGSGTDVEFAGDRFFTTAGRSLRTQPFGVTAIFSGSEGAILVEPDAVSGRVFYLSVTNSTGWLRAFEMDSLNPRGLILFSNVLGTATSLIRWGTNGLAFRTTSNQLFFVRTPLTQPSADADVRAALTPGSNTLFTLVLTNAGPAASGPVQVTNSCRPAAELICMNCTNGTAITNGGNLVWTLPSLPTGGQSALTFALASSQTGVVSVISSAQSTAPDPVPQDNVAVALATLGPPDPDAACRLLRLPVLELLWSPAQARLLLIASNTLAGVQGLLLSVDPATLELRREAPLRPGATQLRMAADNSRIYAALAYGVEERALPTLAWQRRFLLGPTGALQQAADLEVLPGLPNALAVVSSDGMLGVWDAGNPRTNLASCPATGALETGAGPERLYHLAAGTSGFRRFTNNAQGVSLLDVDTTLFPTGTGIDIVRGGSFLYASSGRVINPEARKIVGTIPGIPSGARVRYDETSARVLFLSVGTSNATLQVYDGPTLLPVGSLSLPGPTGALVRFVRLGGDRFAFTTTSNQLWLAHTSLVATNPPADVAVALVQGTPPYTVGSNLTATISITNSGPNPARDVAWNNTLPVGASVVQASATLGTLNIVSNVVSGLVPTLSAGQAATVVVTFNVNTVGVVTNQISALASSIDPAFTNNAATRLLWIQPAAGLPAIVALDLPLKDLARDPVRPLLYASFGSSAGPLADSIVAIDPVHGDIGAPVRVGSDPGVLAVSPDGQFLYVGLDGAGTVQQLSLPDLTPIGGFTVPQNQRVARLAVSPTNANMVVVRRSPGSRTSLHVGGVARPNELADQDLFAFSESNGDLFGCDGTHTNVKLYRLDTSASGLKLLDDQPGKQGPATDLKASGGWLFFDPGMVVNPATKRVRAMMPVPANSLVEPDAAAGRVFYATPSASGWFLRAFDLEQAIEVGNTALPALASAPRRLLRWGADGLALCVSNSQLLLVRGLLVPPPTPADVVLHQVANLLTATTNDTLNFSVLLTNQGPTTAAGVVVTQAISLPVTNLTLAADVGSAVYTNGAVTWRVGSLTTGVLAMLNVSLRVPLAGTLNVSAAAYHDLNDPFWGNNTALSVVRIAGTDAAEVRELRLATRELVYDATRDRLYASTPATNRLFGNLVAVIDPASGALTSAFPAGSEPEQLAVSDNGRFLYVSLNGAFGVQRLDLQSGARDQAFVLGTNDIYFAQDLEAYPGRPATVVASLGAFYKSAGSPSDVILYDDGVPRPAKGGAARGLTIASDGSCVFGYVAPGNGPRFVRMWPGPAGFAASELVGGFSKPPGDLNFANGRLYCTAGQVVEPYASANLGSMAASGPLAVDSGASRAFYLTQQGSNWELWAFDLATLLPTGTQVVANVQGTPGSLIRCGADRLAFRTSAGQLFIVHSALVPASVLKTANLKVSQQPSQDFQAPIETARFTMTVTNGGPANASNVLVIVRPSESLLSHAVQVPQGTSTYNGSNYLCRLGTVAAGQSVAILLSGIITNTMIFSNLVTVSATSPDPDLSDNVSRTNLQGLFWLRPDSFRAFAVNARDLAYDLSRRCLYASVVDTNATGQVVWLDPETGLVAGAIPVAAAPDRLALSDDGHYLYVSGVSTQRIQRVNLETRAVDLQFNLPTSHPLRALRVLPGLPTALAVSCAEYGGAFVAILDNGIARPDTLPNNFKLLAISDDATALYGYDNSSTGGASPDIFQDAIGTGGLKEVSWGPSDTPWGANADMDFVDGRLYFGRGAVFDPNGWVQQTSFPAVTWDQEVEINTKAQRAIFSMSGGSASQIAIFQLLTRQPLSTISVPGYSGAASLRQCGADRLAYRSGAAIVLLRSSAIPSADVVLRGSLSTNTCFAGEPLQLQLLVSNAGPYAVSNVVLTNTLSDSFGILSVSTSQGSVSVSPSALTAWLGGLNTNGVAVLEVVLMANGRALGWLTNSTQVWAADLPDPILSNNRLEQPLFVVDGPRIVSLTPTRNGSAELVVHGALCRSYTLETSTNLREWRPLTTFVCESENQKLSVPLDLSLAASFYRLQSVARSRLPFLALYASSRLPSEPPSLEITALPGYRYALEISTDLIHWSEATNFVGTECMTRLVAPTATGADKRFYRVKAN